ncbi:TonB-dependent receptor plug [Fibrisoma limi BUZ 3]|uniref:TonB-dependent receptor plug n=1 Tax=Fibrisoma limi BUZ 3 TaxID=1185876 RepID=I2GFQ7_9BACT|nr:TonB-dependent receptor [Fibrisoma limi]CCH52732.1 TonB-dependent receptor plug [Fibrisoma limi BUZ 3]
MNRRLLVFCIIYPCLAQAQDSLSTTSPVNSQGRMTDDTLQLNEVTVTGYATNRRLLETAASVGLLTARDLNRRFGTPTLVPSFNTIPGVRADERSPGSYRLSIRGSLIRSPFGVRNVKAYWNELPLTDAGGNTPLNALDVRALGRVEVIKGPSGSLYGAGTGGTVLFGGLAVPAGRSSVEVSALGGSYGLFGNGLTLQTGKNNSAVSLSYNHLQSDGYRENSALVRDNISLVSSFNVSPKRTISILGFYSDLYYQTPGGLNEAQFRANPRQARPGTRTTPGSVEQRAAIYQKLGYLGVSQEYRWSDRIQNTTVIYGSNTDFANPFITNYERRADQGLGGRTITQVRFPNSPLPTTLTIGAEYQRNFTVTRNYGNRRGNTDTLQTDDELRAQQSVIFLQTETTLPARLILTAGLSRNELRYDFTRFSIRPVAPQRRTFDPVWLPRVALLRTFGQNVSAFASISTGYSGPTSLEVLSSTGQFNPTLEPERGTNYEVGFRGSALGSRLRFDVAAYQFQLRQTIVRRSADNGAEFFVNAGRTDQQGLEAQLSYDFVNPVSVSSSLFSLLRLWQNVNLTDYRFRNYQQGATDVSDKRVPGIAPTTLISGFDAELRLGFYAHLTYQFLNPFPLDEANTATALPTRLLQATLGFRRTLGNRWTLDLYASGDNLLNQTYSLGYDLNAFGGRYFNAAAPRNGVAGVRLSVRW